MIDPCPNTEGRPGGAPVPDHYRTRDCISSMDCFQQQLTYFLVYLLTYSSRGVDDTEDVENDD